MNRPAMRARLETLIAGSTISSSLDVDLCTVIDAAAAREALAQQARETRQALQEAAVRYEGARLSTAMPMHRRRAIVATGIGNRLEKHGLSKVPRDRLILRYLRVIEAEKKGGRFVPSASNGAQAVAIETEEGGEHEARSESERQRRRPRSRARKGGREARAKAPSA